LRREGKEKDYDDTEKASYQDREKEKKYNMMQDK
jgi:hypothetical protein